MDEYVYSGDDDDIAGDGGDGAAQLHQHGRPAGHRDHCQCVQEAGRSCCRLCFPVPLHATLLIPRRVDHHRRLPFQVPFVKIPHPPIYDQAGSLCAGHLSWRHRFQLLDAASHRGHQPLHHP